MEEKNYNNQANNEDSAQNKVRHLDESIAKQNKGWTYFINNYRVAILAGLIILISGIMSFVVIPKESAPYIAYGVVNISTSFIGASAEDIDELITQKIESKVKNISGIKKMQSISRNSVSSISIEFEPGQNMTKAVSDIRSKVDEAKPDLPSEITSDPFILEIDSTIEPIISVILHSNEYTEYELKDYAENLKTFAEAINNVASVEVIGGADREISVEVDPVKLNSYGISTDEIINVIRSAHRDTPIGDFEIDNLDYNIRIQGKFQTAEDIENIEIRNLAQGNNKSIVRLSDIAKVIEKGKDNNRFVRFGLQNEETQVTEKAVEISIKKNTGTNIFAINEDVKNKLNKYYEDYLPRNLHMTFSKEVAPEIQDSYDTVYKNGGQAILIVMFLLFIFVGIKAGLVAAMVIPLAFLSTITFLSFTGGTLNFLSNFAMILALGILVDTAIVIVEGIEYYIHKGYSSREAAILSLNEFKQPLISGSLTTLAVFIPLFTLPGVMGQYLAFIPITVFIVLTSSLFVSLLLVTAYGAMFMSSEKYDYCQKTETFLDRIIHKFCSPYHKFRDIFKKFQTGLVRGYGKWLRIFLGSRKMRIGTFYLIILLFILSFRLPIPYVEFPESDMPAFTINIEKTVGTSPEISLESSKKIEDRILQIPEVETVYVSVANNNVSMYIELIDKDIREESEMRTSIEIVNELKKEYANYSDGNIRIGQLANGPPSESPVAFRVIASTKDKIPEAKNIAYELTRLLKDVKGTQGVKNDIETIAGEYIYQVNREKALALGVDSSQAASTIRAAVKGSTAAVINRDSRDIDIVIRYQEDFLKNINDIKNIKILNNKGVFITLGQILDEEFTESLSTVRRRDGAIAFTVSSLLMENGNALEITNQFLEILENYNTPSGIIIENAGENAESAELQQALMQGLVIAILLMFLILVVQFNSYMQPLLILFTILFAQIGVNFGLYITDTVKSMTYIIGVISLAGIVVNDSIIIVDQMNKATKKLKNGGKHVVDTIVYAGKSRFIPVVLTTLTTSAGILPLVWVDAFWKGLALTIVFGLTIASFLTLFITPTLYCQLKYEKVLTFMPLVLIALVYGIINNIFALFQGEVQSLLYIAIFSAIALFLFRYLKKRNAATPRMKTRIVEVE